MCGAFVLARFTPQMEKELKNYVEYFQGIDDCIKKIDYFLKENDEREFRANIGVDFAEFNLTTEQRLKELLILYEFRKSL
jgi:hypothetical protein